MGSLAQNAPVCTGADTGASSTRFRRRFRKFRRRSRRLWCRARSGSTGFSQVRFNRVPEKVPDKVPGGFGAEPGQVQQGSGEGSGESVGDFGAEPGQVQQGSGEGLRGFGAEPGCRARVQSQVRFNRVPEKVPEKVGFGAEPGHVQQGSGEGSGEGLRGFGAEPGQVQQDLRPFNSRKPS